MAEPIASMDKQFRFILETLTPQDSFVIASLAVLADTPSQLVSRLSKVIATGAKVLVSDLPHMDVGTLRATAFAFQGLERKASDLSTELDAVYASRHQEMQAYQVEIRHMILDQLMKSGVDVLSLIPQKPGQQASKAALEDPVGGRRLRRLRENLELSAQEAGETLLPLIGESKMTKQTVSGIETGKITGEKAEIFELALRAEVGRRKRDAVLDERIAKTNGSAGPPLTEVEKRLFPGEVNPNG